MNNDVWSIIKNRRKKGERERERENEKINNSSATCGRFQTGAKEIRSEILVFMLGKKRKKSNDTSLYWDETMKKEKEKEIY